jgi:hypothetical protein
MLDLQAGSFSAKPLKTGRRTVSNDRIRILPDHTGLLHIITDIINKFVWNI